MNWNVILYWALGLSYLAVIIGVAGQRMGILQTKLALAGMAIGLVVGVLTAVVALTIVILSAVGVLDIDKVRVFVVVSAGLAPLLSVSFMVTLLFE